MKAKKELSHDVLPVISDRWSGRAFSGKEIEEADLKSLFEAVRWAASCFNEQPWSFLVGMKNTEMFDKLHGLLKEGNQPWTKDAGALVLVISRDYFIHNKAENKHSWHDVGQGMAHLALEATKRGINIHQMAGFEAKEAEAMLNLPEGYSAVSMTAIGYPAKPEDLTEDKKEGEYAQQKRKSQDDFVFFKEWKAVDVK
jgi:nitroreductase